MIPRILRPLPLALASVVSAFLLQLGCSTPANPPPTALDVPAPPVLQGSPAGNHRPTRYTLKPTQIWRVHLPDQTVFGSSALLLRDQQLLTCNDRQPGLFQINLTQLDQATFNQVPGWFEERALRTVPGRAAVHDFEALAHDESGALYIADESTRSILRQASAGSPIKPLDIDWTPVQRFFSKTDRNASFEGLAIGQGKLFVANERSEGLIIVLDLAALKVIHHFAPRSSKFRFGGPHYSDLSWFDGSLYVLLRHDQVVLRIDPATYQTTAEYDFTAMEFAQDAAYETVYPTGTMEGLAVERDWIWLITDNNGLPRSKHPNDRRPTLFKCRNPQAGTASLD